MRCHGTKRSLFTINPLPPALCKFLAILFNSQRRRAKENVDRATEAEEANEAVLDATNEQTVVVA